MRNIRISLRQLLLIDAVTCAAMGVLLAFGSGPLAQWTNLPAPLLFYAGAALLPITAFMAFVATRAVVPAWAAWTIVAGNVLWVGGSLWVLASGWVLPNALGRAFVAVQAVAVALLAWLEGTAAQDGSRRTALAGSSRATVIDNGAG